MKELKGLNDLNRKQFSSDKEYYDFLMLHIQSHLAEIDELKTNKNPHILKEIADLALLAKMLALHEGVSEEVFKERIEKIRAKILKKVKKED